MIDVFTVSMIFAFYLQLVQIRSFAALILSNQTSFGLNELLISTHQVQWRAHHVQVTAVLANNADTAVTYHILDIYSLRLRFNLLFHDHSYPFMPSNIEKRHF